MRENRLGQVDSDIRNSLPLCLFDRHGEAEPDRKLLSLELKRKHLIIRQTEGDPWQENPLSSMVPQNNFCIDHIPLKSSYYEPRAIAKAVCRVNVSEENNRAVVFQLQQMWWQPVRCQTVP